MPNIATFDHGTYIYIYKYNKSGSFVNGFFVGEELD